MRRLKLLVPVLLLQWAAACGGDGGSPGPIAPPVPANRAPTATGTIPEVTLETGAETTVSVSGAFTDPDGDALTYAAASNATGVATVGVSGSAVRVTGVAPGSATVTVTATDPGGRSATQTFMVTVTAANRAPEAAATIPDQSVEVGADATVDVSGAFSDPDDDALTYAAASDATGVATVDVSGSVITVTGVAPGSATVTVTATDPGDLSVTQTFMVTVTGVNRAPEATSTIPDQNVEVGAGVTVDVSGTFTDPDDDALTHTAESDATGVATVDVSGSELTVTGVAPGSATVTVTATDPGGLSATQTFMVTVTGVNRAPEATSTIPDQNVEVGAEVTVDVSETFTDPDDDALTHTAESDATGVATVDVSGSVITVTGVAPGSATVTVTATDPGNLSVTQTFMVTVEAASGTTDLDALFVPPTAAEIAQVEAEWTTRPPEVSGVQVELDTEVTNFLAGTVRVRVLSHTVGGLRHYGLLVTPPGADPGSLPVVVYAHGGDGGVDLADVLLIIPFMRSVGSVAYVAPSYRSEPLRVEGREFISDGPPSPWDRDVDDTMSLLSVALEEAPELDGERIALLGLSRGGGVSLLMGARDTRIDAVVEAAGPTDLFDGYAREIMEEALAGTLRDLPGLDYLNETLIQPWQRGELSDAEARIEMLRRSGVYFAGRLPPVQLHHGTADQVVAVSQAHRLIEAMEAAGKGEDEFDANIYQGVGHGLLDLVNAGAATRAADFLRPILFGPG